MTQLQIVDLSFYESETSTIHQIQGGVSTSFSTSFQAANQARHFSNWFIVGEYHNPQLVATIFGEINGAAAGSIASAVSDGITFAYTYANASS